MSRKFSWAKTLVTVIFIGMFAWTFYIRLVRAESTTIIVPDHYLSIQEAINAANPGDTVFVRNGTYYENVVLNKSDLALIGENKHVTVIDGNGETIATLKANNTEINGFTVQNGYYGIRMFPWTHGHIISHNIILNNLYGISGHFDCADISICDNIVSLNNRTGIVMLFSDSTISDNLISSNGRGEYLPYSSGIHIASGVLDSKINYCINNTVFGNTIENHQTGILALQYSEENLFFHNNFVNNTKQFYVPPASWNNSLTENYWWDYSGADGNSDGIGDTPYAINSQVEDEYPLMGMYYDFNTSLGYHVNVISNSTIRDFEYFELNRTMKMHVSNMTAGQTFGFCRVYIPDALMDVNNISVIIDDGAVEVLHFNNTIYDNEAHRWTYFAYQHSLRKVVIIPEFPSFLILPLFMIISVLVITIHRISKGNRVRAKLRCAC